MVSWVRAEKRRQFERRKAFAAVWYARGVKCFALALVISLALSLSGCTWLDNLYSGLFTRGAEFYDRMAQGAVDVKCKGLSAGALQRRYMQTPEAWKLWTDECLSAGGKGLPEPSSGTPEE